MATTVYKRLASIYADKLKKPYSVVMNHIRCLLSFSLIRSTIRCLRGSRSPVHSFPSADQIFCSYPALTSWTYSLYSILNYYYHWVWLYFVFCVFKLLSWVLVKKGVKKVSTCTYMHVHVYMSTKNRLFSALPLENLLLSVIYCLFFEFKMPPVWFATSSELYRQSNWIHAFPNKTWRAPLALEIFSYEL